MSVFTPSNIYGSLLPSAQNVRTPRAIVTINDIQVLWADITVNTSTFYIADTFQIELPFSGQPQQVNFSYWSSTTDFTVKIYIGFPNNPLSFTTDDLDLMIVGNADEIEVDPLNKRVFIYGRDYTSKFIDTQSTIKYSNQTSSQIATQLATQQGLTPQITNTTTPIGIFLQSQQTFLTYQNTQWDLLSFLAQQENFVAFVQNNTLIFEPRPSSANNQTNANSPYILTYQPPTLENNIPSFNGESLILSRCMTLTGDVSVTVRVPYNIRTGQAFSKTAKSTHSQDGNNSSSIPSQKYIRVIPGLSPDQCQQRANQLLTDLTIHEVRLTAYLPGDNILKKDSLIKLQGTNTSFDQIYYPDQITRTINIGDGYRMQVYAKNSSVGQEAAA